MYNLKLNLAEFSRLAPRLNISHATVLDCIVDWFVDYGGFGEDRKEKITVKDEGEFQWVNQSSVANELPYLQIKTQSGISKLIKPLVEAGFLKSKIHQHGRQYFQLTDKTRKLYKSDKRNIRI